MSVRILLVDDHRLFRGGLLLMLEGQPDLEVVGEADDGTEAVELAASLGPDLVLMDVSMKGMNGAEATRQILAKRPDTKVLGLSMHDERQFVSALIEAGASGYLLKDCDPEELILAVRVVMDGRAYLSPCVASVVMADYATHLTGAADFAGSALTGRERQVLQLLAEGHSSAAIARRLHLSAKTIGSHREHLMKKLGIHSVSGLTKYAIRSGITTTTADPVA